MNAWLSIVQPVSLFNQLNESKVTIRGYSAFSYDLLAVIQV